MKTIDEDIRSGNLKQIYLLYGTEDYLKRQYRDKLKNALTAAGEDSGMGGMLSGGDGDMNFNRFEGKDINPKQVIDLAETLPFFAERRVILIENSGFFKNACDELAEYLAQPAASTYFVFVEEEVDKRSKMYKAVKNAGKIVEFATQTEELITRWVLARLKKEGKNITGSVMQLFLGKTGSDMGNIDRELEKLIESLTEDMCRIFAESFVRINDNFKAIFKELFGGGHAELILTDPEHVLESGIEISVAPPGKVIKNLISLSGGEQSFVAICIYFAILKLRPAPFCILDEIDAALDEANVRKYAQYLHRFTEHTQFVLVTHRRSAMEEANVLYGVTMQADGVSRLLKLEQPDLDTTTQA